MPKLNFQEQLPLILMDAGALVGGAGLIIGQANVATNTSAQMVFTIALALIVICVILRWVHQLRKNLAQTPNRIPDNEPWRIAVIGIWVVAAIFWLLVIGLGIQLVRGVTLMALGHFIAAIGFGTLASGAGLLFHRLRTNYLNALPKDYDRFQGVPEANDGFDEN